MSLIFKSASPVDSQQFDLVQEREMQAFCDRYVVTDRLLGSGAFGKVFMAIEQSARSQLACKVVDLRLIGAKSKTVASLDGPRFAAAYDSKAELKKIRSWGNQKKREMPTQNKLSIYFREFEILSSISHPNIIALDKVFVTNNNLYIFQDLITAGDLFSYLHSKNNGLIEVEAAVIVRQILVAVHFLHERNIAHRDLKPENIMMTGLATGARIVLTNFGSARKVFQHQRPNTIAGSEQYGAPEMFNFPSKFFTQRMLGGNAIAADMWSVGVIAALLLTGFLPFDQTPGRHNSLLASTGDLGKLENSSRWKGLGDRPRGFIHGLLVLDENDRMTAEEALNHAWFSNHVHKIDFEALYKRTVKHWRPRIPSVPTVEFLKGKSCKVKSLPCSQHFLSDHDVHQRDRLRPRDIPVDPPYRPFPRKMHEQGGLWPKRRKIGAMSSEVKESIEKNWSRNASSPVHPSVAENQRRSAQFKKPLQPAIRLSTGKVTFTRMEILKSSLQTSKGSGRVRAKPSRIDGVQSSVVSKSSPGVLGRVLASEPEKTHPTADIVTVRSLILEPVHPDPSRTNQTPTQSPCSVLTPFVDKSVDFLSFTAQKTTPPMALNVLSKSKLKSRPMSSLVDRQISVVLSKRRRSSIFDQEYEGNPSSGEGNMRATTTYQCDTEKGDLKARSKDVVDSIWPHSEHLRVNDEDSE